MLAFSWSRRAATVLVIAAGLVGCSSHETSGAAADGGGAADAAASASAGTGTVGASGGTVSTADHHVTVQIPPGALDSDVTITIAPITAPAPGALGQAYEIGPTGTQFRLAATITFEYSSDALGGVPASQVAVSTLIGAAWQSVSVPSLDATAQTISGTTSHLSPYALAAMGGSTADGGAAGDSGAQSDGGSTSSDAGADACTTTCNGACVDLQNDSANCGACGVSCSASAPSTSKCAMGRCVTTLTQFNYPATFAGIVLVGNNVVWADNYNDPPNFVYASILSVPMGGGSMSTVLSLKSSPCGTGASYLQTDGANLYFAGYGICSYPLAGGTPSAIVPGNVASTVMGYAQVSQAPYWVDNANGLATYSAQAAKSLVPAGGNIFAYVLSDAVRLYWLEGAGDPTSQSGGTLYALPLAGGTPTALATSLPDINQATLGTDAFYGIGSKATGIGKVPLAGGAMQTLYVTPSPQTTSINSLTVDASNIYWAESSAQTRAIRSMPLGGGPVTTLWTESAGAAANVVPSMVSDGTSLYWVTWDNSASSRVMKTTVH